MLAEHAYVFMPFYPIRKYIKNWKNQKMSLVLGVSLHSFFFFFEPHPQQPHAIVSRSFYVFFVY
jgi:hypothetical protein